MVESFGRPDFKEGVAVVPRAPGPPKFGRLGAELMHRWDEGTDLLAHSVIGYAVERLKTPKDPTWGARPADELAVALEGAIRRRASAATPR